MYQISTKNHHIHREDSVYIQEIIVWISKIDANVILLQCIRSEILHIDASETSEISMHPSWRSYPHHLCTSAVGLRIYACTPFKESLLSNLSKLPSQRFDIRVGRYSRFQPLQTVIVNLHTAKKRQNCWSEAKHKQSFGICMKLKLDAPPQWRIVLIQLRGDR